MRRSDLEHIIRACAALTGDSDIIVIGSQAILASHPDAPSALLRSNEADVFPRNHREHADRIDANIGELSLFHETHSVYAHLVGPETAKAPEGWEARLIPITGPGTAGATGWCLEPHDLVLAKLARGDANDREFAAVALAHGLVHVDTLRDRLVQMPLSEQHKSYSANLLLAAIAAAAKLETPGGKHTVDLLTAARQGPGWVDGAERDGRSVPGHWRPAARPLPPEARPHLGSGFPGDPDRDPGLSR